MSQTKQTLQASAKHARILEIAGRMFITQSYADVSMDALAEAVPVSKRTLYNHFTDKKGLFIEVMKARCCQVFGRVEETLGAAPDPQTALTHMGLDFLDKVFEPDSLNIYRTAIMQSQTFPELGKLFYANGPERLIGILSQYFSGLHEKGTLDIGQPTLAASTFLNMLAGNLRMRCLLGLAGSVSAKEKQAVIEYAVALFLKGHQPKRRGAGAPVRKPDTRR